MPVMRMATIQGRVVETADVIAVPGVRSAKISKRQDKGVDRYIIYVIRRQVPDYERARQISYAATMESMASELSPFLYDPAYPFLFCTVCKYAVLVSSTTEHLRSVHKDIPIGRRSVVRTATSKLTSMYRNKDEANQFSFPNPESAPIPHIKQPVEDGYQCKECGWITTSDTRRRTHAHSINNRRKGHSQWRTGVRCQRLFAKGTRSAWFEVGRDQARPGVSVAEWACTDALFGQDDVYQTASGDASVAIDLTLLYQTTVPNTEGESHSSFVEAAPEDSIMDIDPSWLEASKTRAGCVLCTVRDFQQRCMGDLPGYTVQNTADEAQLVAGSRSCRRCSLPIDWTAGIPDERLRDEELVRVARVLALWEQMRSIGMSLAGFDRKHMAAACTWLVADDNGGDAGGQGVDWYTTPQRTTAVTRNGQITPPDEPYDDVDIFGDDEIGMIDPYTLESSPSAPRVGGVKRRATVTDLAMRPAPKMANTKAGEATMTVQSSPLAKKEAIARGLGAKSLAAPILFNDHIVAQVRRTGDGMRHTGMSEHDLEAYAKWMRLYRSGDCRSKAADFRRLHKEWHGRCAICWFGRGDTELHSPDRCPRRGSKQWALTVRHAEVIQDTVLTKRVVRGAAIGWPVGSGCWRCGLPAWRCESFVHIPGRFFWPRVPEGGCQDGDMLRHIAGSVLAHFELGAACVVAQVKESWAKEGIDLASKDGIDWLQDNSGWTDPECSFFALLVFELARFGSMARR